MGNELLSLYDLKRLRVSRKEGLFIDLKDLCFESSWIQQFEDNIVSRSTNLQLNCAEDLGTDSTLSAIFSMLILCILEILFNWFGYLLQEGNSQGRPQTPEGPLLNG